MIKIGDAEVEYGVSAENEQELKAEVITLDSAKRYSFFMKDMTLGNIGEQESRFGDICFDLISDMRVFANSIQERQFITYLLKYKNNTQYKESTDEEVKAYNKMITKQKDKIRKKIKTEQNDEIKESLELEIEELREIDHNEYFKMLSIEEGSNNFFDFASDKMITAVYAKLNLSRSKDGFQQKELFRKRLEQKFKETTKTKGILDRGSEQ